jgi:hypothetical protein
LDGLAAKVLTEIANANTEHSGVANELEQAVTIAASILMDNNTSGNDNEFLQLIAKYALAKGKLDGLATEILTKVASADTALHENGGVADEWGLAGFIALAASILTDCTVSNSLPSSSIHNASQLTASGYNYELLRLLAKYGEIGSSSTAANVSIDEIITYLGGVVTEEGQSAFSDVTNALLSGSTSDLLGGGNTDALGTNKTNIEPDSKSLFAIKTSNINASLGAKVVIESGANVDVSAYLGKANGSKDRKVLVIGAAKDLTIKGDVTFTNTNEVEDHALSIGAADEVYFRSEYSSENSADYADPDPITVKYTGSNMGIGSYDTMRLVNVNLETGGNLALSTLDELHITSSRPDDQSTFTVGTGGKNSDPDNVYLYAHNLIQADGLQFGGRVDDVYMEAITINLKEVQFPSHSEIMCRSRYGTLHFNTYSSPVVGSVNLTDVSYGGTTLNEGMFSGSSGHINSGITLQNSTPAVKIRGFSTENTDDVSPPATDPTDTETPEIIDLTSGLVAYFPFNGNANDESGKGNHGTIRGGATLGTDRHGVDGKTYSFDGMNDYIHVGGPSSLTNSPNQTMSIGVKGEGVAYWNDNTNAGGDTKITIQDTGLVRFSAHSHNQRSSSYNLFTEEPVSLDEWHHVVGTIEDDLHFKIYVDGQFLIGSTDSAPYNHNGRAHISIGSGHNGFQGYFDGSLDDIRHYTRALSAADVAGLYELERPKDSDSDGLCDAYEIYITTDPNDNDTDEDGLLDGEEVHIGTNPKSSDATLVNFFNAKAETRETNARTNALVEGEATGVATVKADPTAHNLVTKNAYDQMVEQLINSSDTTPYTDGWFYYPNRGWMWTNRTSYPYFYDSSTDGWMYFKSGEDKPRFYHYGTKAWVTLGE